MRLKLAVSLISAVGVVAATMLAGAVATRAPGAGRGVMSTRDGLRPMSEGEVARLLRPAPGFPRLGRYQVVSTSGGGAPQRSMRDLIASNPKMLEGFLLKDFAHGCRDIYAQVGGGVFTAGARCDAPDGDIHNIAYHLSGSYREDGLRLVEEAVLWGNSLPLDVTVYRLVAPD